MELLQEFFSRSSERLRGIAAIILAVFLLSFSDALVKLVGDRFGLAQIILIRSLMAGTLIGVGLLVTAGPPALHPKRPGWVWLRSLSLTAMWLTYYAALPSMPLALAAACYYTSPIWMALMARFLLGTKIGSRRWMAIGLSMVGVILAVNPRPGSLFPVILLPLAAAMFYALAGTITWSRCQDETAGAMAFNLNVCLCVVAGLALLGLAIFQPAGGEEFVLAIWPALRPWDWALAGLLGGLLAIVTTTVALAYRLAPPPIVGVFDTAYLGFAALWGAVFFADVPTPQEAVGIGLIASGAVLMSWRSTRQDEVGA